MVWLCVGLLSLLSGCGGIAYYAQAINGHAQLLHHSESIHVLLRDAPDMAPALRERLLKVLEIRAFASEQLALPDNGSYRRFASLSTKAVVWSLVATPEFSVAPRHWCYPLIGCASYRGYFSEHEANAEAARQARQGYDVTVNPVAAYSTLGWFDDPLPSTVIDWPEPLLAGLIFHELAHQKLYIQDDSAFNESFASALQRAGVERWLARRGTPQMRADWQQRQQREAMFVALLQQTRRRLQALYRKPLALERLRAAKQAEWQRLREHYQRVSAHWPPGTGYAAWFERPLNNARFAAVQTYEQWVPAFLALLDQQQGDFSAFYRTVREISAWPQQRRDAYLRRLLPAEASAPAT